MEGETRERAKIALDLFNDLKKEAGKAWGKKRQIKFRNMAIKAAAVFLIEQRSGKKQH